MCGVCGRVQSGWYDRKLRQIRDFPSGDMRIYLELEIRRIDCRSCQGVKQEKLDWLADNPFYTKRFAFYRPTLSIVFDPGCGEGTPSRLESRQDTRDAVHARTDQARWSTQARRHWH